MVLFEELKNTIPSKEREFCSQAKYVDRFYEWTPPPTPERTKRLDTWSNPDVEQTRIFHALVNDEQLNVARNMYHGKTSRDRTQVRELIRPEDPSALAAHLTRVREGIYESSKKKPLGRLPQSNLPDHIDMYKTVFGIPTRKDGEVGLLVNPPRTRVELLREEAEDRQHYIISHKRLIQGEQGRRRYDNFDRTKAFGEPSYADPRGILVRRALDWKSPTSKHTPVMSRRQFDFNERFGYKLGVKRDPNADTREHLPFDHAFGLPRGNNEMTVGQLLHGKIPRQLAGLPFDNLPLRASTGNEDRLCVSSQARAEALMPVVHHVLREKVFVRGADITAVLCHMAAGADLVPMLDARELMHHFNVPLDEELMEQMFDTVMVKAPEEMTQEMEQRLNKPKPTNRVWGRMPRDGHLSGWAIDWRLLAQFVDWKRNPIEKDKLTECGCLTDQSTKLGHGEVAEAVRRRLRRAIDANVLTYQLTSEEYTGDSAGLVKADCWKRMGKPPVELHIPVPKLRKPVNTTDYGDEGNIRAVLQPNVYTEYGLSQRDLLKLRTKAEISQLINATGMVDKLGVGENMEKIWSRALEMDKEILDELAPVDQDHVTLYGFKEALFELHGQHIRKMVTREYTDRCC